MAGQYLFKLTNDRPVFILIDQWQVSIYFNWPIVGQYDVIFIGIILSFLHIISQQWRIENHLFVIVGEASNLKETFVANRIMKISLFKI